MKVCGIVPQVNKHRSYFQNGGHDVLPPLAMQQRPPSACDVIGSLYALQSLIHSSFVLISKFTQMRFDGSNPQVESSQFPSLAFTVSSWLSPSKFVPIYLATCLHTFIDYARIVASIHLNNKIQFN